MARHQNQSTSLRFSSRRRPLSRLPARVSSQSFHKSSCAVSWQNPGRHHLCFSRVRLISLRSVNDIQMSLFDVWNNPRLSAHLLKEQDLAIDSIRVRKHASKKRKSYLADPAELPPEVVDLQKELDMVMLDSWKLVRITCSRVHTK